ncbi:MAG: hypothetical protein U1E62_10370 [Alsobacter sp.]
MVQPATPGADATSAAAWRRFAATLLAATAAGLLLVLAFVTAFDPYGMGPAARRDRPVLMDLNQRYMYPQIVRSGRFDSAVFGTSTVRLLEPARLAGLFGGAFANLAMNSATPWEQVQIADLFLRRSPAPRTLVWGLDPLWCEPDATTERKRLTFRGFPATFYDENPWNDWPEYLNLKTIEIAWRMMMFRLGLMPERYRNDGYEVFTPPEATYDLARAQGHIWQGNKDRTIVPQVPAAEPSAVERAGWTFPALAWLDATLSRLPRETAVILAFPPVHVAVQPAPGSAAAAYEAACKEAVASLARRHNALALDFRLASEVTRSDSNYWDPLHYRLPIADRLADALAAGWAGGRAEPADFDRVLAAPRRD